MERRTRATGSGLGKRRARPGIATYRGPHRLPCKALHLERPAKQLRGCDQQNQKRFFRKSASEGRGLRPAAPVDYESLRPDDASLAASRLWLVSPPFVSQRAIMTLTARGAMR